MNIPNRTKFRNKVYCLNPILAGSYFTSKSKANERAEKLRKQGYSVIVKTIEGKYILYFRLKQKAKVNKKYPNIDECKTTPPNYGW